MAPLTLAKIAIRALLRNRMRTFLSVLGIVIGVAAVIAMVAMGEGSRISIKEQMTSMGSNAIIIMPNRDRRGGVQMESSEMLEEADVIAIREQATYIDGVSPMVTVGGQAIVGNNNSPTTPGSRRPRSCRSGRTAAHPAFPRLPCADNGRHW